MRKGKGKRGKAMKSEWLKKAKSEAWAAARVEDVRVWRVAVFALVSIAESLDTLANYYGVERESEDDDLQP